MYSNETTISQHFYLYNSRKDIRTHIKGYSNCQNNKKQIFKCVLLPDKQAKDIHPYKIRREGHNDPLIIKALTVIYLTNRWFEIIKYK